MKPALVTRGTLLDINRGASKLRSTFSRGLSFILGEVNDCVRCAANFWLFLKEENTEKEKYRGGRGRGKNTERELFLLFFLKI